VPARVSNPRTQVSSDRALDSKAALCRLPRSPATHKKIIPIPVQISRADTHKIEPRPPEKLQNSEASYKGQENERKYDPYDNYRRCAGEQICKLRQQENGYQHDVDHS
jgi:hypothetical protein